MPRARAGIDSTYSAEEDLSDPEDGRDDTGEDGHLDGPFSFLLSFFLEHCRFNNGRVSGGIEIEKVSQSGSWGDVGARDAWPTL